MVSSSWFDIGSFGLLYTSAPFPALIDRLVIDDAQPEARGEPRRISGLAEKQRWVLLGEPGSGKSTTFEQAAVADGTSALTARAFLEGARPLGDTLFLDAVEEYRIGEAGHERLAQLVKAIKDSGYTRWRLTCRSASLNAPDLKLLANTLGDFETWHLAPLDKTQQRDILTSLGEADSAAILQKVDDLAAAPLMGNPATLKLLYETLSSATGPIHSRGELFDHATRAMSEEINPDLPERPDRSTPGAIVTAAEKACLVMILSARSELWLLGSKRPHPEMIVRDDLLPAEIDTQALNDAVDTPMFRGEAGSFSPTHRMVSEYLAGRALAKATMPLDGAPPALPYRRAYALLCGQDDEPAPALIGTFAWFVTTLADGVHAARALDLVKRHPEAILFQGDAARLPTDHRRALLEATGRGDPWFMSNYQGATAIGGLAGEDLGDELRIILHDKNETVHRRGMVLEALTTGRRVPGLDGDLENFAVDAANPDWLRRLAIGAILARVPKHKAMLRRIVKALNDEVPATAMSVKLEALASLVGTDVTTLEAHAALKAYARTGDGVMGYGWSFGHALELDPPLDFFETPIDAAKIIGESRSFEVRGIIERVLAALIRANPQASAQDILRWLRNGGFDWHDDPHEAVRHAIKAWTELKPKSPWKLFWTLHREEPDRAWHAAVSYSRLVGGEPPRTIVLQVLRRLKASKAGKAALRLAWLAYSIMGPFEPDNAIYWRLWRTLDGREDLKPVFDQITFVPMDHWQVEQNREQRMRKAKQSAAVDKDREWLTDNLDKVRSGVTTHALNFSAFVYCGHYDRGHGYGRPRLLTWVDAPVVNAITEGWTTVMANFPISWRQQARQEAKNTVYNVNIMAAVWADDRITRGETLSDLSLDAAFGILRGYYSLQGDARESVQKQAAERIVRDPEGLKALVSYWKTATRTDSHDLPHASTFEALDGAGPAVAAYLKDRPDPGMTVLRSALAMAGRTMSAADLLRLVEKTLAKKTLSDEARSLWSFVGFLLAPDRYEAQFSKDATSASIGGLLDRINRGHLIHGFDRLTSSTMIRDRAIVQHLGPHYPPNDGYSGDRDDMSQVVAGALKGLGATPTAEASEALTTLAAMPALAAWDSVIKHHTAQQKVLRQQAEFRAPEPKVVAKAVLSGPPATPADLRAVVCEILDDLARDIHDGDTSGWRGFWNHPGDAEARRPKEENDCRDLLLDRVRDRLIRFGVGANRAFPEARRRNDRRTDILLIGQNAASLPIEAKRHLHTAIWTAGATQLPDYGRSPGSEGHGIYLIFWFGAGAGPVPKIPVGTGPITTAQGLQEALRARQPQGLRTLIDIIVIDVSPPPDKPKKKLTAKSVKASTTKPPSKAANPAKGPPRAPRPAAKTRSAT